MDSVLEATSPIHLRALCQAIWILPAIDNPVPYASVTKSAKTDILLAVRCLVNVYSSTLGNTGVTVPADQVFVSLKETEQRLEQIKTYPWRCPPSNGEFPEKSAIEYIDTIGRCWNISTDTNAEIYTLERVLITAALHGELGLQLPTEFPTVKSINEFIQALRRVNITIHKWVVCSADCETKHAPQRLLVTADGTIAIRNNSPMEKCKGCQYMPLFVTSKQIWYDSGENYSWGRDGSGLFQLLPIKFAFTAARFDVGVESTPSEEWKAFLRWSQS